MAIHYIQSWCNTKPLNIGGAINSDIRQLNTNGEDWIVSMDSDILWLLPDSKNQLEHILNSTDYDLLGPVTNRLAMPYQVVSGMFDELNIAVHVNTARVMQDNHFGEVTPYQNILAALCICFRVKTWKQLGGFMENSLQFDYMFSVAAQKCGLNLGLMNGIYVFHNYRILSDNPKMDIKHLL